MLQPLMRMAISAFPQSPPSVCLMWSERKSKNVFHLPQCIVLPTATNWRPPNSVPMIGLPIPCCCSRRRSLASCSSIFCLTTSGGINVR